VNADRRYLYADCGLIAIAIHRVRGWALVELLEPWHVLAEMPDGRLLDVSGPHDPGCLEGASWRRGNEAALVRRFGRLAAAADVVDAARELLSACGPDTPSVALARPAVPRRVTVGADLRGCGLVPVAGP
jgi:hypothetical protein